MFELSGVRVTGSSLYFYKFEKTAKEFKINLLLLCSGVNLFASSGVG